MAAIRPRGIGIGLAIWTALGCGDKPAGATREDCTVIAEHVANLIMADAAANPDALWDAIHAAPGDTGLPTDLDKSGFKTWLDSPAGKTWMMGRRGNVLAGTQVGIEPCVQKAAPRTWVTCMLATKSKADVEACDAKANK